MVYIRDSPSVPCPASAARAVKCATPGKRIKLPRCLAYIYVRGIRRDERTTAIRAEGCGIKETNRIFEVSFYDRRRWVFFLYEYIYIHFFLILLSLSFRNVNTVANSPAKRWRWQSDVNYAFVSTGRAFI